MRTAGWLVAICLTIVGLALPSVVASPANADYVIWSVDDDIPDEDQGGGGESVAQSECYFQGAGIPCSYNGAWWNGACYDSLWSSDPNDPDPDKQLVWKSFGYTEGALYACAYAADGSPLISKIRWAPNPNPPPTTQELENAARWLLEGTVTAPELGVWPGELGTDESLWPGAVGMPAWFWSKNPGPGVGAPDTKTTTIKGYTIRATATLVKTIWDTGDGNTVTCDLGVEPVNVRKVKPPPTGCGHTYLERGDYTITATTHVQVQWSGAGRSGTIPLTVSRSAVYHVGEIQVVITTGD